MENTDKVKEEALTILEHGKMYAVIETDEQYEKAGQLSRDITLLLKEIDTTFKPIKQGIDQSKKVVLDKEKAAKAPALEAREILNPAMVTYDNKKQAERAAAQRKAEEEARKAAEDAKLKEAQELEDSGHKAAALEVLNEEPDYIPPAPVAAALKPKGVSYRITYSAEVTSLSELIKAVVDGKVPEMAIAPNMTFLNKQARAMMDDFDYRGCRVIATKIPVSRAG